MWKSVRSDFHLKYYSFLVVIIADVIVMIEDSVKITREAYEKIALYAKLIPEITGLDLECGGLLIDPKSQNDCISRDAYLIYGQEVTHSSGIFGGSSIMEAYGNLKQKA